MSLYMTNVLSDEEEEKAASHQPLRVTIVGHEWLTGWYICTSWQCKKGLLRSVCKDVQHKIGYCLKHTFNKILWMLMLWWDLFLAEQNWGGRQLYAKEAKFSWWAVKVSKDWTVCAFLLGGWFDLSKSIELHFYMDRKACELVALKKIKDINKYIFLYIS